MPLWRLVLAMAWVLLTAVSAPAQEAAVAAAVDSLATVLPDSLATVTDRPVLQPVSAALAPIDLWDTGLSPTTAVVMTPFFPGWGQLYGRNSWQAALGFGAEMYFWSNMLTRDRRAVRATDYSRTYAPENPNRDRYRAIADENWEQMRDFAWWSGGVLLIIALDAYVGAHLYNFDQDPVPVPDRWDDTFGPVGATGPGADAGPTLVVFQWRTAF
jgi:hypothetical protein